jgi:amino acid transporter
LPCSASSLSPALLATASSINANLHGAGNVTAALAASKLFPPNFGSRAWVGGTRGLTLTVAAVLVVLDVLDLSAIASLGSAIALIIFAIVGVAEFRLRHETGSRLGPGARGARHAGGPRGVPHRPRGLRARDGRGVLVTAVLAAIRDVAWRRPRAWLTAWGRMPGARPVETTGDDSGGRR